MRIASFSGYFWGVLTFSRKVSNFRSFGFTSNFLWLGRFWHFFVKCNTGCRKETNSLHNVIPFVSLNSLQHYSTARNSDFMKLPPHIQILHVFENRKISDVLIPNIMSKIVLDIRTCKGIFWKYFYSLWTQKLVSIRNEISIICSMLIHSMLIHAIKILIQLRARKFIGKL